MKRLIPVLLLALLLTACAYLPHAPAQSTQPSTEQVTLPPETTVPETTALRTGFITEQGVTRYRKEDGSFHTGWLEEDERRYYLNEEGVLQTGWLQLDGQRFYLQPDGAVTRGSAQIDGETWFFAASGAELPMVNPWTFMHEGYTPDLVDTENGYRVDSSCAEALLQMLHDCRDAGFDAQITSAYRDNDTQVFLYDRKVNYFLSLGYDRQTAEKEAGTIIAVPGTSEHQLGLAVDLVDSSYWVLDEAQENTPAQKWLMEHCWEYGFILRYPNEKSAVTGIIYEPWHYRYVGVEVAQTLKDTGLCLEEYLLSLQT